MRQMNWREGGARIARVTAIAYWSIAAVGLALSWWNALLRYTPGVEPYSGTYDRDWSLTPHATTETGGYLFWIAVTYGVLVLIFRGLRWIVRGFASPSTPA